MSLSDIILEMELGGVDNEHISLIVNRYKESALSKQQMDEMLTEFGYAPVFTVDYDAYDEYGDYEESDYFEKSHHRQEWD